MPYAAVNDIELYYEELGQGTPLVLIHGFSGSGMVWDRVVPQLSSNYRVIVLDLRGHCRSGGTLETIHHAWFARDLLALLDHLGIDRAHFVGHSSGGMCLLFIGTGQQERILTLTLVNATYTFDEHGRRHMLEVADSLEQDAAGIEMSDAMHGPYKGKGYWKVLREAFREFTRDPKELPWQPDDLRVITRPVLILHGDRDEFFPVYIPVNMYRAMPNSELCILPQTGHGLPEERFDWFMSITADFLNRHTERFTP